MPKKNAKSTLSGAIIGAMFFLEDEGMGQYLFAATSRKQAGICFKIAKNMISK
jgi:phage terminase large subunit-like protein